MITITKHRGMDPSHSNYKIYNFDKVPLIETIILSNASKLKIEPGSRYGYSNVVTCFGDDEENIFLCYDEKSSARVLAYLTALLMSERSYDLTLAQIEANAKVEHVKNIYGTGEEELALYAR